MKEKNSQKKYVSHCKFKETNAIVITLNSKSFVLCVALCIKLSRSCYKAYFEHIEDSLPLHNSIKYFWPYIKKYKKTFSLLGHVTHEDRLSNSDQDASEMFGSVCPEP